MLQLYPNPCRASINSAFCPAGRIHEFHAQGAALVDGYAPFCKHVFVPNFVGAKAGAMLVSTDLLASCNFGPIAARQQLSRDASTCLSLKPHTG